MRVVLTRTFGPVAGAGPAGAPIIFARRRLVEAAARIIAGQGTIVAAAFAEAILIAAAPKLAAPTAVSVVGAAARPPVPACTLIAQAVLVPPPLGFVIAEPRSDLVTRSVEEAAIVGAAAAPVVAYRAGTVGMTVFGPSGTLVAWHFARVITVIGHAYSPSTGTGVKPVHYPAIKRTGVCGRSCHGGMRRS